MGRETHSRLVGCSLTKHEYVRLTCTSFLRKGHLRHSVLDKGRCDSSLRRGKAQRVSSTHLFVFLLHQSHRTTTHGPSHSPSSNRSTFLNRLSRLFCHRDSGDDSDCFYKFVRLVDRVRLLVRILTHLLISHAFPRSLYPHVITQSSGLATTPSSR